MHRERNWDSNFSSAVTWSVDNGTIDQSGNYTASNVLPASGMSTVKATSVADSSKSGSTQVSLLYPSPVALAVSPSSVSLGSPSTTITVTGANLAAVSVVSFDGQALTTTFVSPTELTAVIPSTDLSSPETATVNVTTPSPGGGTSAGVQFTVATGAVLSKLTIVATPAFGGSVEGPWQVSVGAANPNANIIPNLSITLQVSEGTITPSQGFTDSTGVFAATVSPPTPYSGEAVAVSAASGNQMAVANIAFVASLSGAVALRKP